MSAFILSNFMQNPRVAAESFEVILKSFVVLASTGVLCLVWRRWAAASLRHVIWFFGLASLLCLPVLALLPVSHRPEWVVGGRPLSGNTFSLSLQLTPNQPVPADNQFALVLTQVSANPAPQRNEKAFIITHVSHNWMTIGFVAWAFGVFLTLLYPVIGQFQLRKISRKARALETPHWTLLLKETSASLGLSRRVRLLQTAESIMPLTWGWLRPKVLLPVEAELWPADRQRVVLLHELAHVKRWDCLTQNIARLACALYWFNPLAWLASRRLCVERERACDDLVLNGGCAASDYADHLVEIARSFRHAPQIAAIAMARPSGLQKRIVAIVDATRPRRFHPVAAATILFLLGVGIYFGGVSSAQTIKNAAATTLDSQQLNQLKAFSEEKLKQAQQLAASSGEKISPEFQLFFDAATGGDWQTVNKMDDSFKLRHPQYERKGVPVDIRLRASYWSTVLEICLAYDHISHCDPKYTQIAVNDMFQSIASGSIYFGGTDPGRGLPTAFSKSHVNADPFYTVTQNALADGTYLEYLRNTYGERRHWLSLLSEARRADSELQTWDNDFENALETEASLMSQLPEKDAKCETADKATEGLRKKRTERTDKILAELQAQTDAQKKAALLTGPPQSIYIPTEDDMQNSFKEYTEDAGRRLQHDQEFPNEPRQIKPGENVSKDQDGKIQVSGQVAVMAINARLAKIIFDKNPGREFFIEESFPLHWMYPHLEPSGPIMKINREPLAELPDDVIQKDHAYWQDRVNQMVGNWLTDETRVKTVADFVEKVYVQKDLSGFTGDPAFIRDNYAPKMFSKWRSSIAGVYAWRIGVSPDGDQTPSQYQAKSDADQQRMIKEADFAFKQAFAICPSSPEAVYRYVNFLLNQKRKADAYLIAQAAAYVDPEHFDGLMRSLSQMRNADASAYLAYGMEALQDQIVKKQAALNQQRTLLEGLKAMDREKLKKAMPIAITDNELNNLLTELDLAQQQFTKLKVNYSPDHPKYRNEAEAVEDLQRKIDNRTEGIMIGLQAKVDSSASMVANLKSRLEELQSAKQR
jgi:beta-lactamase regulating signal transducer with metallopeptidase domain